MAAASHRPTHGFSLIELIVTMVVLGVLLMAVTPFVRDWMFDTEIRNAAESISTGLAQARAEAVRRNEPVMFSLVSNAQPGKLDNDCKLSATSASWVVSLDSPAGQCAQSPSATTSPRLVTRHARGDGSSGVVVEVRDADCSQTTSRAQVVFNGYGRAQPDPAPLRCIVIKHPGSSSTRTLHVVLNSGGAVRTCDPAATDPRDTRRCLVN